MQRASEAAREGDIAYFQDLDDAELKLLGSKYDEDGRTLFHSAVAAGARPLVDLLLERTEVTPDKIINAADEDGWTPLISAASCGHTDLTTKLISLGADVNATTHQNRNALHYAASKGFADVVKLLIDAKCDVFARDSTGATVMHRSAGAGKLDVLRLLLSKARQLVNVRDAAGVTPLLAAADSGEAACVALLMENGADPDVADAEGNFSAALERNAAVRQAVEAAVKAMRQQQQ